MATATPRDDAADAAEILHEDKVSEVVQHALKQLEGKRWVLFHAKDYLLGVLQLLEARNLLRDVKREAEMDKVVRETRAALEARVKGYFRLARIAAEILPASYRAEVDRIYNVRTMEELDNTAVTKIEAAGWAHAGSGPDAIALAKVRKLARESYKRQTIKRADLLEALGISDGR